MRKGDMVMALAQLSFEPSEHVREVQRLRTTGKFVIVDNGACEGVRLSFQELQQASLFIGASELVLPDVLGDSSATLIEATKFLLWRTITPDFMGVVQGTNMEELQQLVGAYSELMNVTTLGLPRLLLKSIGLSVRIELANWIAENFPGRFAIHLLGASSLWVKEVYFAAKYASHIRSIDTSLPYNYGLQGIKIDSEEQVRIERAGGYFTIDRSMRDLATVMHNEEVYKSWSKGTL